MKSLLSVLVIAAAMMLAVPWRKTLRDIWRERTRAMLVIVAIAIGLSGFLAVLSMMPSCAAS